MCWLESEAVRRGARPRSSTLRASPDAHAYHGGHSSETPPRKQEHGVGWLF